MNIRRWIYITVTVVFAGVILSLSRLFEYKNKGERQIEDVVIPVKTAKMVEKDIVQIISAYGTVIPAPGAIDVLTVPFESYIKSVYVNNGQMISKGDHLLEIQPSPTAALTFDEAKSSYETAKQTLAHIKELLDLKLATNEQYLSAQLKLEQASLRLENMRKQGLEGFQSLIAAADGIIKTVNAQQGSIVPPGTSLVEIVSQNRFEINLGIEAEDIHRLKVGQKVFLSSVYNPFSTKTVGDIRKLSYSINPVSQLVDIFVAIPYPSPFLFGELVLAHIDIVSGHGIVVPRTAIVTKNNRFYVFTCEDDHAIQYEVELGIRNANEVMIQSKNLNIHNPLIIEGNYELSNGMRVKIEE